MPSLVRPDSPAGSLLRSLGMLYGWVVVLASFVGTAGAATIYSDLGAGNSYDSSHGLVLGKQPFNLSLAAEFVNGAGGDVNLQQVDLGLSYISGGNAATVSLWSAEQNAPGSELAQWSISVPTSPATTPGLLSITGISSVSLQSGAAYFLQVQPVAPDSILTWSLNDVGATTRLFTVTSGVNTPLDISNAPAFQLSGTMLPTPLPSGVWLMFSGLLALVLYTSRKSLPLCFKLETRL